MREHESKIQQIHKFNNNIDMSYSERNLRRYLLLTYDDKEKQRVQGHPYSKLSHKIEC